MTTREQKDLLAIFKAGLAAVEPEEAVRRHVVRRGRKLRLGRRCLDLGRVRNIFVVGAGKASARMAGALEEILGDRITGGWVSVKRGSGLPCSEAPAHTTGFRIPPSPSAVRSGAGSPVVKCQRILQGSAIRIHEAGHPIPDEAGLRGAREIARILRAAEKDDLVLLCLSGGGSALLPLPVAGVSLADKQRVTQSLLACGADIREVNTVRKHLSQLKGGRLAQAAQPAEVVAIILSDVVGDPLDSIASGPTAPDGTTFADALSVLKKYSIERRAPRSVFRHLQAGAAGAEAETPKPGDPVFSRVHNLLIANNSAAVEACARKARALGWRPLVLSSSIEGEAREAARVHVAIARECLTHGQPAVPPACLISGGETTVTLRGDGLGGRNQEFALAAALAARGMEGVTVLAAGTDGTDGPTDAAGAFADGQTCARAAQLGLSASDFLARNDSYHFFERLGDLLKTGPTGTNVMDLYLLLVGKSKQSPG